VDSPGEAPRSRNDEAGIQELDRDTLRAIDDAAAWLAEKQAPESGAWTGPQKNYKMSYTALAGLALLAHGDTPDSGRWSKQVRKTVEWVLASQRREGQEWPGLIYDRDTMEEDDRPMHGHGFALLFLAEAYGNTRDPVLRERMHRAIRAASRVCDTTLSPDGGWYYHPNANRDEGSVTITQIQGLRSAHNAGISVNTVTIDRAVKYIKDSQMEDGGIRYTKNWGKTSPALTAAGVSCLHGAGEYDSQAVERCYEYLRQHLRTDPDQQFFFYTQLYAAQAMHQRGGPEWASYFPRIRRELLDMRRGKRYWHDVQFGPVYGTASALLVLQIPLRYLPIFQR
jgi:hypothetical protein